MRGTRILLRTVLGFLAHGEPVERLYAEFPTLNAEHVRAAIAFAAAAAGEDLPPPNQVPTLGTS